MTDERTNEEIVESTSRHLEAVERYERWKPGSGWPTRSSC